jgi:hypothetical protein
LWIVRSSNDHSGVETPLRHNQMSDLYALSWDIM